MLEFLAHYIIIFIETTKYFGIFILMTLESALIPIPSEVTMPFSGFLAVQGKLNFWWVVIVGTFANLVGSLIAYYLGFLLEETVLLKILHKWGKYILVSEREYHHASRWFQKYGDKIIFISRLLPGIRTIISLPAGMFEMDIKKFIFYTTVGCFFWSAFLTYIGFALGENWNLLEGYFQKFEILIILTVAATVIWYINHKFQILRNLIKTKRS